MQQNQVLDMSELKNIAKVANIQVTITAQLGTTKIALQDLIEYDKDTIIKLDNLKDQPINIFVNEILVAKAQIVAVEGYYGIKIVEIFNKNPLGTTDEHI